MLTLWTSIPWYLKITNVVATTCWNSTCSMLTSAKLLTGYLVVGIIKELDKEPSLHCFSIYINTMWSMLQQYLPALKASYFITHPPCFYLKATMLYSCALTSYSLYQDRRKWTWLFFFSFYFYFSFRFIFLFSIFRTTRVRVDQSYCHISHNLMV